MVRTVKGLRNLFLIGVVFLSLFVVNGYGEDQQIDPPREALNLLIAGRSLEEKNPQQAIAKYEDAITKMEDSAYTGWVYFLIAETISVRTQEFSSSTDFYKKAIRSISFSVIKDEKALNIIKERLTLTRFNILKKALARYYLDEVEYPESLDKLSGSSLVKAETIDDGWGRPFSYTAKSMKSVPQFKRQRYEVFSRGPDGNIGGGDDIPSDFLKKGKGHFSDRFIMKGTSQIGGKFSVFIREKTQEKSRLVESGSSVDGARVILADAKGVVIAYGAILEILIPK